jgi:transcription antitermination protein NusB
MADSSSVDQRHLKRIKLMQALFAYTFNEDGDRPQDLVPSQDLLPQVKAIVAEFEELDQVLQKYAPERPLPDINLVDLAILRLILWESWHEKTPKKVLIDEAVELAKEFGSDSSSRFVNGVLGKILMDN